MLEDAIHSTIMPLKYSGKASAAKREIVERYAWRVTPVWDPMRGGLISQTKAEAPTPPGVTVKD